MPSDQFVLYLVLPITARVLEKIHTTLKVQTVKFIFVLRLKESLEDIVHTEQSDYGNGYHT